MRSLSRFEINLAAISHNIRQVRSSLDPDVGICAVLKADAYGLGAVRIASQLNRSGVEMFAVYTPAQAQVVLRARLCAPVLVLAPVRESGPLEQLQGALAAGYVQLTLHDEQHVRELECIAGELHTPLAVHVEVDTGMSRGGITCPAAADVIRAVHDSPLLRLQGIYTHLASAGHDADFTMRQSERFDGLLRRAARWIPPDCVIHEANTFGLLRGRRHHRGMVRIGLLWAGYGPEEFAGRADTRVQDLRPVLRWMSRIVHVKEIPVGTNVGYGSIWQAQRPTRLALVPVGYADGYPLTLGAATGSPPGGEVGFFDRDGSVTYAPVVGRVSMDQITVDITDIPARSAQTGMPVEIVSDNPAAPNHLPELARRAGTVTHELLCRLGPPVHRIYVNSAADDINIIPAVRTTVPEKNH